MQKSILFISTLIVSVSASCIYINRFIQSVVVDFNGDVIDHKNVCKALFTFANLVVENG